MIQTKRKTNVRRNRGLKDECRGQQTRDIDPRQQQHILRMLYPVKAARLLFITLCCGSVEEIATPGVGVSLSIPGPTGLALTAWGRWGRTTTLLRYLGDADAAPCSRGT